MAWLVTGGAGYVGSHAIRQLRLENQSVCVLDDLSTGHRTNLHDGVDLISATLGDSKSLAVALQRHHVTGVIHLAARLPADTPYLSDHFLYQDNTGCTLRLVDAMHAAEVRRLVLVSSAAVYGERETTSPGEVPSLAPKSIYGRSKAIGEQICIDYAATGAFGLTILRLFNVAGIEPGLLRKKPGVIGRAASKLLDGLPFHIHGSAWPSRDGSAIRDYVHVTDVALAISAAAKASDRGTPSCPKIVDIGSGRDTTVNEVISGLERLSGLKMQTIVAQPRAGAVGISVADSTAASQTLGWRPTYDLRAILESEWIAAGGRVSQIEEAE